MRRSIAGVESRKALLQSLSSRARILRWNWSIWESDFAKATSTLELVIAKAGQEKVHYRPRE